MWVCLHVALVIHVSQEFVGALLAPCSVPAFEQDVYHDVDALKTPLSSPVPMNNCIGCQCDAMDTTPFDRHLATDIPRWMPGDIGEGAEGTVSRNGALCSSYKNRAHLGKYSRSKHEDSTVATTRSDRTDKLEGVTLVKVEETDFSLREAIDDLARKARWLPHYARLPFVFGIAVTTDQLRIYALHADITMVEVFSADLDDIVVERWQCVVAAINIARTLKLFVQQGWAISSSIRFDAWHNRNNKKRIRLDVNVAEIEFNDREVFLHMCEYCRKTAEVPLLEHPCIANPFNAAKNRIRLVPVGV